LINIKNKYSKVALKHMNKGNYSKYKNKDYKKKKEKTRKTT
jgi:hypothetical protein